MSLLDDLRNKIADAILPSQKRGLLPYDRMASQRNIGAVAAGNELEASIRGTVFACLQHRANALSAAKFNTYKESNFERSELGADHWAARLLSNPNPYFVRSQIYSYIENWLSINGNAFIWTPTNGYHVPLQMWVLNPTRVRIIKGSEKFIDGYVYQSAQDGNIAIPEKEMIHLARIHPAARPEEIVGMNILGVGLVTAALEYANIDREVSNYLQRLFRNNTVPPLIAEHPDTVDMETWVKIRDGWNEALPDFKLRALLHGGMKLNVPPKGELTIGYDAVSKDTRSQIAQVFGVPPGMLTGEFQNKATAEVQFSIFRQNTIDPEALYIAEELTRHFRRFEDDVLIEAEPYLLRDVDAELKQEEFELRWGIKTINDARAERGFNTISGGDVPLIANGFVPLSGAIAPMAKPSTPQLTAKAPQMPVTARSFPYNTNEARAEFWRNYDGLTTKNQNDITEVVAGAIDQVKKKIKTQIEQGKTDLSGVQLDEAMEREITTATQTAVQNIAGALAVQLEGNAIPLDGEYGTALRNLANETAGKINESVETIKTEFSKTLSENANKSKSELLEILNTRFDGVYSQSRLRTIANTTAANVTSGSQLATYKRLGYTYIWLTEQDNRVRPSHKIMEGKETDPDGFFSVPVMKKGITEEGTEGDVVIGYEKTERPLGSGLSASGAVNCRCQLFPVQRQKTETVQVTTKPKPETPTSGTTGAKTPPRIIAGGRGSQLKAITDFEDKYKNLRTHEMGMLTDYDGNIISEAKGDATSVNLYSKLTPQTRRQLIIDGNTIGTHNHPVGSSFSPPDIMNSFANNRAEFRAVGPRYTYVLQRPENGYTLRNKARKYWQENGMYEDEGFQILADDAKKVERAYNKELKDIKTEMLDFYTLPKDKVSEDLHELYDMYKDGTATQDRELLWENMSHVINLRLAKKYKYNYERFVTGGG